MSEERHDKRSEQRARRMLTTLCEGGLKLASAESCTGGLIAALVTDIEGCSHAFERGFVVYSDDAKHDLLGVPRAILEEQGAVSEDAARAMAEGALQRSGADLAISVTGYAGPTEDGGTEGDVHFALARTGETQHRFERFGPRGRDVIRQCCVDTVLEMLESAVS